MRKTRDGLITKRQGRLRLLLVQSCLLMVHCQESTSQYSEYKPGGNVGTHKGHKSDKNRHSDVYF